jgi:hypothetical protein
MPRMPRPITCLAACLAALACTVSARAQDDELWAQIDKSLKAHGGKEFLKKHPAAQIKYKGEVDAMGALIKIEGEVWAAPERMKNTSDIDINGMKLAIKQGYDGKTMWMDVMGMLQEFKDEDKIKEAKESMHAEQVANLVDLDKKNYQLNSLGEMKIKGKEAIGIRVAREGKRDVLLWFDKATNLLVKNEHRGADPWAPQAAEANNEKYYSDYKAVNGVQTPGRLEVHQDGKKIVELEIIEIRYHERLDDSIFAKP